MSTGKPRNNYDCNAGVIWSIDVNASGSKLAVGCDDGSVVFVDISGGLGVLEHDLICQRQDSRVLSIKWHGDQVVLGGCADGRIRSWSAAADTRGRILATMRVDKSKTESTLVWSIAVLPAKKQFVSGDSTGAVKFWDLESFSLLQTYQTHDADVLCLATDHHQERVFSAGIDRKIHQFNLMASKTSVKWVHTCNRLLHSNDIRTMASYESRGTSILISGGVERSIVVQSVANFQEGNYRKMTVTQQKSNVVVSRELGLIALFQDQTIKIWKVLLAGGHALMAKIVLADEENIGGIALNCDATLLAVGRSLSVRVFQLAFLEDPKSLKVTKFRDEKFDSLGLGAKFVRFYANNKMLIVTPEEEIYQFQVNAEDQSISLVGEIETLLSPGDVSGRTGGVQYANAISNAVISPEQNKFVLSRFNGCIEIYPLVEGGVPHTIAKLSARPHLIVFSGSDKLVSIGSDNKILEFNVDPAESNLLTAWSIRNSEFLPRQFLHSEDKPQGAFYKLQRLWVYGSHWTAFFDMALNVALAKGGKAQGKKRNRQGLDVSEEGDGDEDVEALETSLKTAQLERMKSIVQTDEGEADMSETRPPFWLTSKYRNIVKVDCFGDDGIVVIERPQFMMPKSPAFGTPKFKI